MGFFKLSGPRLDDNYRVDRAVFLPPIVIHGMFCMGPGPRGFGYFWFPQKVAEFFFCWGELVKY